MFGIYFCNLFKIIINMNESKIIFSISKNVKMIIWRNIKKFSVMIHNYLITYILIIMNKVKLIYKKVIKILHI
jgi:hypothetical protein